MNMTKKMRKAMDRMLSKSKKGQAANINTLIGWVIGVFFLGLIAAFLLVVLSKFGGVSAVTADANSTINTLITELGNLADWFGLLILVGVLIVVMGGFLAVYYLVNAGFMRGR